MAAPTRHEAGRSASGLAWRRWWLGLGLVVATVVAYGPALGGGFVWDDDTHITENTTLRSLRGLWAIWFEPGATCQYYPLTFTGFWVGYHLWGLNPVGYHLVNVLLHCGVALLLWQVLERLRVRGAWLAGAIFALHPVCVMSVAWVTELKNTLSGCLLLGSIWAYVRYAGLGVYAGEAGQGVKRAWGWYGLSVGLFMLAMLAKTAVSFVPVTLLLVVWWQRERIGWREVWPLLPMMGLVAGLGQVTFAVERLSGAMGEDFRLGLLERVLVSGRSFWFYLGKLVVPNQLTFIYERWSIDREAWWQYGYPVAVAGLLWGLWRLRGRLGKGLLVAVIHFYVATSLLILLTVLYMTQFSWVSDHWQYYGSMSMVSLAAAGIVRGLEHFGKGRGWLTAAVCGVLLGVLGLLTWQQSRMYRDVETLWRTTLARNPSCWLALNNLAIEAVRLGRAPEAVRHLEQALRLRSDDAEVYNNLAWALATNENEAVRDGPRAVKLAERADQLAKAKDPRILDTLAAAYAEAGRFPDAVRTAAAAVELANRTGQTEQARRIRARLELYQAGRPYRDLRTSD